MKSSSTQTGRQCLDTPDPSPPSPPSSSRLLVLPLRRILFSQVLIGRILPGVSILGENHPRKSLATTTINKPYQETDVDTWFLFDRPLLADCSLHEESKLDLHYNNLWLQLQRWLSFCIDFCILIFVFSLGHTGRKEPLQNLQQVSRRGGGKNHIANSDR